LVLEDLLDRLGLGNHLGRLGLLDLDYLLDRLDL
jgi:hypothetical protein